jgi:ribosomal protein S18 acetylase RimI-like enzyme
MVLRDNERLFDRSSTTYSGGRVRLLEELTLNAWPPLETRLFDGWLLGFSGGYTRRAKSIQPLYASTLPLLEKIEWCEAISRARTVPLTFKITSECPDDALDSLLHERGFVLAAPTSVQIADLSEAAGVDEGEGVVLSPLVEERWFADFNRLTHTPPALHGAERSLLEKIAPAHRFASIALDGETVALGLAVQEREYVGLFDIVVDPRVRNQALGRRVCTALLGWGASAGARLGHLGVMQDNTAALHLYAGLGFREAYTYWYRSAPQLPN